MATTTPIYGLRKPAGTDVVNVALDISGNMDLLDSHAHSGTYARRRKYDVRDYLGSDDIGAAINRAYAAAAADAYGYGKPGQVVLPPLNLPLTTIIVPVTGVDLIGSGWGKTVLRPQGVVAAFAKDYTTFSPLADATFANFEIDGSEQAGTFAVSIKGMYLTTLKRVTFQHLLIRHTGASGLGCDFLYDTLIDDVIVEDAGRLGTISSPGCAGIGIGTNTYGGSLTVRSCVTRSNKRCGIFFESQDGTLGSHIKLIGHQSESNGEHGIADAGCAGLQVIGGHSKLNGKSGFATYSGTIGTGTPGSNGLVSGLDCSSNTEHGYHFDTTVNDSAGLYVVSGGAKARNNTRYGFLLDVGAGAYPGLSLDGVKAVANGRSGALVVSAGGVIDEFAVSGSDISNNGTDTGQTANLRAGISLLASITRLRIAGGTVLTDKRASGKTQTYGLHTAPGTVFTNGAIEADMSGNLTQAWDNQGTGPNVLGLINGYTVNNGSPEGAVKAPIGTRYSRVDGGAGTSLYVKESGTSTTGWAPYSSGDQDALTTGESTMPRSTPQSAITLSSQTLRLAYFTAKKTETVTQVRVNCVGAAGATPSLIRVGIWTADAAGALLAQVAATTNDTALLAAGSTNYTKALTASFAKVTGQRYAVGLLVVTAAAAPTVAGSAPTVTAGELGASPKLSGVITGSADLPSTVTAGGVTDSTNRPYVVLLP
jgi:hypothetical protein